jgi:hypothetical protein
VLVLRLTAVEWGRAISLDCALEHTGWERTEKRVWTIIVLACTRYVRSTYRTCMREVVRASVAVSQLWSFVNAFAPWESARWDFGYATYPTP